MEKIIFIGKSCCVDLTGLAEREFRSILLSYVLALHGGDVENVEKTLSPIEVLVLRRNFMLLLMSIVEACDDNSNTCDDLVRCVEECLDRYRVLVLTMEEVKVDSLSCPPEV